jgi:transcriptional regulator with GAF, ATPase, and Fis domain
MKTGRELSRDCNRKTSPYATNATRCRCFGELVGASSPLKADLLRIGKVASTDCTVLVTGETGTGKELIARTIHTKSRRSDHPLVSVNCAAVAPSMIPFELVGNERRALTGAMQRRLPILAIKGVWRPC